ncbi:MAG: recombination mediator RecR [Patescibacteria group bacterium]|nr:recombination mediator RecR [Patescibacteria group bacterium]
MAKYLPKNVEDLINELGRLPGIGPKTAQRLAFHILKSPDRVARGLSDAVARVREGIGLCRECFNLCTGEICEICDDSSRDKEVICVVEDSLDLIAIEKTGEFKGVYHVLHGLIAPLDGIGVDDIRMKELQERVAKGGLDGELSVKEVIVATNPNLEGEATALYIARMLDGLDVSVSRIARGLPSGGDLEYADHTTLSRALEGRGAM